MSKITKIPGAKGPSAPAPATAAAEQAAQANPDPCLGVSPVHPGANEIDAEDLEDVLQSSEHLFIMVCRIDIEGISSTHQMPVQAAEQGDLVSQEAVEMVLQVSCPIEFCRRTIGIIGRQLEAIEVFAGEKRLVPIEMLVVLDIYGIGIEKSSY